MKYMYIVNKICQLINNLTDFFRFQHINIKQERQRYKTNITLCSGIPWPSHSSVCHLEAPQT